MQETTTLTVPVSYQKNETGKVTCEKAVKHGDLFIMSKLWSILFERSW